MKNEESWMRGQQTCPLTIHLRPFCNTEFFRPVYEKKVYVQECKYQGLAREGGQDTLPKKDRMTPNVSSSSFYLRKRT